MAAKISSLANQAANALGLAGPKRSLEECAAIMTGKGGFHETTEQVVNGIVQRVYVNAPPNLPLVWLNAVNLYEDRTYVVLGRHRYTFAEAHKHVIAIAHALQANGIQKGDRVCIAMRNLPEWIFSFWAIECIGAVVAAVNVWLPHDAVVHCINKSGSKIIIADAPRAEELAPAAAILKQAGVKSTWVVGGKTLISGTQRFEDAIAKYRDQTELPDVDIGADDHAALFCTSGTTSLPKLVLQTHRMITTNLLNCTAGMHRMALRRGESVPIPQPTDPQKSILLSVPLFHVTGCHSLLLLASAAGGKVVILPKWDAATAVRLIKEEKIILAGGVPSMAAEILDKARDDKSTTLESLLYGGAPAPLGLPSEAAKISPGTHLSVAYGLTETAAVAVSFGGEDYAIHPDSTGLAVPVNDLRIMDMETLRVKEVGEVGEIWIKGPNVAQGYYQDEKATREAFLPDGWFRSGDVGRLDEEGFLYIVDRAKDIIIRGGENITSVVVENAIYSDSRVLECAVVPVPDNVLGELVAAIVTPKPAYIGKLTEEDVKKACVGKIAKFSIPVIVDIRSELIERNANGKLVKKDLKKQIA